MSNVKQVIVIRKDLMDPLEEYVGKMIAQGGHGVGGNIIKLANNGKSLLEQTPEIINGKYTLNLEIEVGSDLDEWFRGMFTKICVYVKSEQKLLDVCEAALKENIVATLVEDNGLTKFNGVKTKTAVVLGPDSSDKIDKITRRLRLL